MIRNYGRFDLPRCNEGASLVELALVLPVLMMLLVLAVDIGRAYYVAIETESAAQAGAMYGAQNPTDIDGIVAASKLDAADISTFTVNATVGYECFDGSTSTCSGNLLNYVEVNTKSTYVPLIPYPGFISSSFEFKSKVKARAAR